MSHVEGGGVAAGEAAPLLLEVRGISKRFAGVQALEDISFTVRAGEVRALLGENGAGKSTLVKILAGAQSADSGEILVDGEVLTRATPAASRAAGIAVVHQEFNLVPHMTVLDNLFLGTEMNGAGFLRLALQRRRAGEVATRMGVDLPLSARVEGLTVAQQQRVEIARALLEGSKVIVMDEPSAVLAGTELDLLFGIIRTLRDQGVGVIYISHRLSELRALADSVTVLRDGRFIATRAMADVTESDLVRLMVGRDVRGEHAAREHFGGEILAVRNLQLFRRTQPFDVSVAAGEVVGIAGLVGAGRSRLANVLAGLHKPFSGTTSIEGKPLRYGQPARAIASGVAVVPEDRRHEGVVLDLDISENVILPNLENVTWRGFVRRSSARALADRVIAELGVRPANPRHPAGLLSGGNQQKVVFGKLAVRSPAPRVFVLDEPTRGIDIGAKEEVYTLISRLTREGAAVVLISSDLPEILRCSHRIYVMRSGTIVGELPGGATEEDVMSMAVSEDDGSAS
ncbi:sugar ABC transporter ATP-binding protein [Agromyces bauzanensis]